MLRRNWGERGRKESVFLTRTVSERTNTNALSSTVHSSNLRNQSVYDAIYRSISLPYFRLPAGYLKMERKSESQPMREGDVA